MNLFDITPAGTFTNAIEAASRSAVERRKAPQPQQKATKPATRSFVQRVASVFMF